MPHILADRVLESSTSTGTGDMALSAAVAGFRRFSAVCAVGDTVAYFIEAIDSLGQPTGDYEYGKGTYSAANTLTRTTIEGSSNGGAAVNFAAGSKNVGIGLTAAGFAASLATSGYTKLPNGLILQWGQKAMDGTSGAQAVVFPIPFSNPPFMVQAQNNSNNYPTLVGAITTTGCNLANSSGGSGAGTAHWFAIGH